MNWRFFVTVVLGIVVGALGSQSIRSKTSTPGTTHFDNDSEIAPLIQQRVEVQLSAKYETEENRFMPTVFIGILVRNKAHSLPYFLRGLEIQDYPTDRITLKFICDNSLDSSVEILNMWAVAVRDVYRSVDIETDGSEMVQEPMWSENHYRHVMKLRQRLLDEARQAWADFYLTIDADVLLVYNGTLRHLVRVSKNPERYLPHGDRESITVISPLINCTTSEYYSNFWGAMTEQGYYERSPNYFAIQRRHLLGIHPVAMVHSVFLINLCDIPSANLSYHPVPNAYSGPIDDLILFARLAQAAQVKFFLDNTHFYGYLPAPVEEGDLNGVGSIAEQWINREMDLFVHLRFQALLDHEDRFRALPSKHLVQIANALLPVPSKLGMDEIYYINLDRRPDRKSKMEYFLDQLGIAAQRISAFDGSTLNPSKLMELGIEQLQGYYDPYHKRSLKYGEIGCFLSHYDLWQKMLEHGHQKILILEDDVRFAPGFVSNLAQALREADVSRPDWELIYVGRKRMSKNETRVPGTHKLVYPDYTYWTLGYVLKIDGAKKLLAQNPLKKLLAVDEFLPIMFGRHPQKTWLEQFSPRNLVALSAEPLLLEPQRYTGEKYYVSDTEDSEVLSVKSKNQ